MINQFTQMDEQTREKRVERNLEVDRQRIIRSEHKIVMMLQSKSGVVTEMMYII